MEKSPQHIGIIIDGNRRWAKSQNLPYWKGHQKGAETVENTIEWSEELGIKTLTIYCLSTENLKRNEEELRYLFKLFKTWFKKQKKDKRIKEKSIKIKFIGDLSLVPRDIQELATEMENDTKNHKNFTVNFCFAYGGRQEIIHAIKKLVKSGEEINEENFQKNLYLKEEPELIIRTGDKSRLSNFLPWQSTYSELIFLNKMWPDFSKEDLVSCIEKFRKIQRNFGK